MIRCGKVLANSLKWCWSKDEGEIVMEGGKWFKCMREGDGGGWSTEGGSYGR